ncbi:MAG: hypothetical protein ACTHU0_14070 [Kofleriaceae bacterium]
MLALSVVPALVPAVAAAAPRELPRLVVWQDRVLPAPSDPAALANVSHTLYLNDCRPNGCTVRPGGDNSLNNTSSIPRTLVTLPAYPHGQAHWDELVACVRETFKPFDIQVVTAAPDPANHFEVMIGGSSVQLRSDLDAGGVAPFIGCGAARNNVVSFVFPETTENVNYLCGAVVQEAAHVWGLDHSLNAKDPMTYLQLGSLKRFQNDDAQCGESAPRRCQCGDNRQNSYRYMTDAFGLSPSLAPPTLTLLTPTEGQWVKAGFPINATFTSELYTLSAALAVDGTAVETLHQSAIAFNAPASLKAGPHEVSLTVTDAGDRSLTETVNVNVMAACNASAPCPGKFHCLGGYCLPGASTAGGLGASCSDNGDCVTHSCAAASDGTESACVAACDAGNTCPSGFACLADANVCWPSESSGCAAGNVPGSASSGFLLCGLTALVFALRRRR